MLFRSFAKIMDVGFTAKMEENLDQIEEGTIDSKGVLKEFYPSFKVQVDFANEKIERRQILIDKTCPQCSRPMTVKWGRNGKFLSCSGFPECKFAQPFMTGIICPQENCGGELVERRSKRGSTFYGCSKFPECKYLANKLPTEKADVPASEA